MNIIRSHFFKQIESTSCLEVCDPQTIKDSYSGYCVDESRLAGSEPSIIFFPKSIDEVSSAVKRCAEQEWSITVSGARTGIVGGAVVDKTDAVISLEGLKQIEIIDKHNLKVGAGVTLDELSDFIASNLPDMFYPVDPTETTASIGGTVATNASGARSYFYSATRNWINALTLVLADGSILKIRRGEIFAENRSFIIEIPSGERRVFTFPQFEYPKVKSTVGFQMTDGMDAVDLFIGSEGILGIITEIELRLAPLLPNRLYTTFWLQNESVALSFVRELKKSRQMKLLAIEYFDSNSLNLLRKERERNESESRIPKIPDDAGAAIFIDSIYDDESHLSQITLEIDRTLNQFNRGLEDTWSGLDSRDLERMKQFRHALPETINNLISRRKEKIPQIHKLSTDLAVPDGKLKDMLLIYHTRLSDEKIEYVIFGHIGDNHLHMNMLPSNMDELTRAKSLYIEFAKDAVRLGGVIAAEHGIGRIKRDLLRLQYPEEVIKSMQRLKKIFDPSLILNPNVLLPKHNNSNI